MYLYRLAGENLELAKAEIEGLMSSQGSSSRIYRTGTLGFTEEEPEFPKRLALAHSVSELIRVESETEELEDLKVEGPFRIESFADEPGIEEDIGELVSSSGNEVDLENPDTVIEIHNVEGFYLAAERVVDIDRGLFQDRSNEKREYSSPVSLDPVTARVLVNLTGTPHGNHIVDPFCGTGGILVEAGLCGIGVKGGDIDPEMVEGTKENLEQFGILNYEIVETDYHELWEKIDGKAHSVVCDLPYGRSSKVENLSDDLLEVFEELGEEKAVFVYNEPEFLGLEHSYSLYVHGSLTRYIYVYDLS